MTPLLTLIQSIKDEDQLLRSYLARLPRGAREVRGEGGGLSFKETLGHIAFWDDFTVQFFLSKIDRASCAVPAPADFESQNEAALTQTRRLPFGEVLVRYLESTGALVDFLTAHWADLSSRERHDFLVPLQHRRQHRLSLVDSLGLDDLPGAASDCDTMAAEA